MPREANSLPNNDSRRVRLASFTRPWGPGSRERLPSYLWTAVDLASLHYHFPLIIPTQRKTRHSALLDVIVNGWSCSSYEFHVRSQSCEGLSEQVLSQSIRSWDVSWNHLNSGGNGACALWSRCELSFLWRHHVLTLYIQESHFPKRQALPVSATAFYNLLTTWSKGWTNLGSSSLSNGEVLQLTINLMIRNISGQYHPFCF